MITDDRRAYADAEEKTDKTVKNGPKIFSNISEQIKNGKYTGIIILACVGVGLIVIGNLASIEVNNKNYYTDDAKPVQQNLITSSEKNETISQTQKYKNDLESRLKTILSKVKGAGNVYVEVTLSGSIINKYAVNSDVHESKTDEYDNGSVKKSSLQTQKKEDALMVNSSSSSTERPVIIGEELPKVEGVLIVAEGAFDSKVKMELSQAVEALLGVEPHRVMVLTAER